MKFNVKVLGAIGSLLTGIGLVAGQVADTTPPPNGIEVQTRGPVHEAFAQPYYPIAGPGQAVPNEPPPAITERQPEDRPQGNNVQWIAGYWAWDAERSDFVWVSGTYRNAPPGRQFIAGHWVNTADGWRWIPGFWASEDQNEITYAAQPPAPLDTARSIAPPDDNSSYVPGNWLFRDDTFIWRPGYYAQNRAGRIWVAPRYIWTPAGYIFADGYWDYPLEDRGMLFAPVRFNNPLGRTAGWFYRPDYVVVLNPLIDALFWRTGNHHYYFGNFYGSNYGRMGYQPWFGRGNDPLFNYYGWANRANGNWAQGQQQVFNGRQNGQLAGPALTLAQQTASNRVVMPLNQLASNQVSLTRIVPAAANFQRTNQLTQSRAFHENGRGIAAAGVPRIVNNSLATPHVVSPAVVHHTAAAARGVGSQNHSLASAATHHHAAPAATHAGRTAHVTSHSGGSGGHRGRR